MGADFAETSSPYVSPSFSVFFSFVLMSFSLNGS